MKIVGFCNGNLIKVCSRMYKERTIKKDQQSRRSVWPAQCSLANIKFGAKCTDIEHQPIVAPKSLMAMEGVAMAEACVPVEELGSEAKLRKKRC